MTHLLSSCMGRTTKSLPKLGIAHGGILKQIVAIINCSSVGGGNFTYIVLDPNEYLSNRNYKTHNEEEQIFLIPFPLQSAPSHPPPMSPRVWGASGFAGGGL